MNKKSKPKPASRKKRPVDPDADSRDQPPPPGLNNDKHALAQKRAAEADFVRRALFSSFMATAVSRDGYVSATGFYIYLDRIMKDLGDPKDPIERMMIEQLAMAHFRVAELQVAAANATGSEAAKLYSAAAARMLGEFRRTALSLKAYRSPVSRDKADPSLKVLRMAR